MALARGLVVRPVIGEEPRLDILGDLATRCRLYNTLCSSPMTRTCSFDMGRTRRAAGQEKGTALKSVSSVSLVFWRGVTTSIGRERSLKA